MARRDVNNQDYSEFAVTNLDQIIRSQIDGGASEGGLSLTEAMEGPRVLQVNSDRDTVRVLFISTDTELLNPTRQSLDGYLRVSDIFSEVHIMVLRQGLPPQRPVYRPDKNVYIYTVGATYWWQLPWYARALAHQELSFASGFRPDLIVARDPFVSALTAYWFGREFSRPTQLHMLQNYYHPDFCDVSGKSWWEYQLLRYTPKLFDSIRTKSGQMLDTVQAISPDTDVDQLPQLNPYQAISTIPQTLDLKERYPQYLFTLLFVGSLEDPEPALAAVDAARYMLRNKKICLIIIGTGAGRSECKNRVNAYGIEEQVIFLEPGLDIIQFLKAAQLLIVTHADAQSEELVLQAAGARLPMVMVRTERREDIFTHRESAYMYDPGDIQAPSDGVFELMNDFELRKHISDQAQEVVTKHFHSDPREYQVEYRSSIESALFVGDLSETETATQATDETKA